MEICFIITISLMMSTGVYLMLRPRLFPVVLGLFILGHAANLIILLMGMLADALITRLGRIAPAGPASAVTEENNEITLDDPNRKE